MISVQELQMDLEGYLRRCCDTGRSLMVELPDGRQLAIQRHLNALDVNQANGALHKPRLSTRPRAKKPAGKK